MELFSGRDLSAKLSFAAETSGFILCMCTCMLKASISAVRHSVCNKSFSAYFLLNHAMVVPADKMFIELQLNIQAVLFHFFKCKRNPNHICCCIEAMLAKSHPVSWQEQGVNQQGIKSVDWCDHSTTTTNIMSVCYILSFVFMDKPRQTWTNQI